MPKRWQHFGVHNAPHPRNIPVRRLVALQPLLDNSRDGVFGSLTLRITPCQRILTGLDGPKESQCLGAGTVRCPFPARRAGAAVLGESHATFWDGSPPPGPVLHKVRSRPGGADAQAEPGQFVIVVRPNWRTVHSSLADRESRHHAPSAAVAGVVASPPRRHHCGMYGNVGE